MRSPNCFLSHDGAPVLCIILHYFHTSVVRGSFLVVNSEIPVLAAIMMTDPTFILVSGISWYQRQRSRDRGYIPVTCPRSLSCSCDEAVHVAE